MKEKDLDSVKSELEKINQEHLVEFWNELGENEKEFLLEDIEELDPDLVQKLAKIVRENITTSTYEPGKLQPADVVLVPETKADEKRFHTAFQYGETALKDGKVGVILVAGGQGTRLGFDGPKGAFPVGPITSRTLFQYHTEKIIALEQKYQVKLPFYIMTSTLNDRETKDFFKKHDYFGKDPSTIQFFKQGTLPTFSKEGKILLEEKYKISKSPDGHGGLVKALKKNNIFADMKTRNLEVVFYFQVDNVLVKMCDPEFVGMHIMQSADLSAKTVYKRNPEEKLGNIGILDNKYITVEYSELSKEEKYATTKSGRLKFGQGSIAIHVFNVSFLEKLANMKEGLPYHLANKKIKHIDTHGNKIEPQNPNGFKLEQFIFDAFPYARDVMAMETKREQEFSPIKNAKGEDSPETARRDLCNLFGDWLESCNITVHRGEKDNVTDKIEISPLYANNSSSLCSKIDYDIQFEGQLLLE